MSYKQIIVVRKDLKMNVGKIASQVAHASLGAYEKSDENMKRCWKQSGEKKVVLRVGSRKELLETYKKAREEGLTCFLVKDAGLTQLKSGTITALGIGPDEEKRIDKITKKLKLL